MLLFGVLVFALVTWQHQRNSIFPWVYNEDVDMQTGERFASASLDARKTENTAFGRLHVRCRFQNTPARFLFQVESQRPSTFAYYRFDTDEKLPLETNSKLPQLISTSPNERGYSDFVNRFPTAENLFIKFTGSEISLLFDVSGYSAVIRRLTNYCGVTPKTNL